MRISQPRASIHSGVAYAPATVADALGISAEDFDDWLANEKIDLPVLRFPDGSRRIPGDAVLQLMGSSGKANHPLAGTDGKIAADVLYTPDQAATILGIAWKRRSRRRNWGPNGPKAVENW